MRRTLSCACAWAIGLTIAVGHDLAGSAREYSPLQLLCRPNAYISAAYSRSEAVYMFFVQEPISYDLVVHNAGADTLPLRLGSANPRDIFTFRSTLNGKAVVLSMSVAPDVDIEDPGRGQLRVEFSPVLTMRPSQRLIFRWQLQQAQAVPGRYRIDVEPHLTDNGGRPIAPVASILDFEVRDVSTPEAVADRALRRAWRAYFDGQTQEAITTADELLDENPRSYAALMFKGFVMAKTDRVAADQFYRSARAIVVGNADPWCLQCADADYRARVAKEIGCAISGMVCE